MLHIIIITGRGRWDRNYPHFLDETRAAQGKLGLLRGPTTSSMPPVPISPNLDSSPVATLDVSRLVYLVMCY